MKDETFDVALWGLDWDSIDRGEHLFQGITALNACCLALDSPVGTLFNRRGIAESLSESGSFPALYGIDLKGKYCVLRNLVPASSEEHFPGGTHEVCRAQYLMISDAPFNHTGRIVKLRCSFSHLDQWSKTNCQSFTLCRRMRRLRFPLKRGHPIQGRCFRMTGGVSISYTVWINVPSLRRALVSKSAVISFSHSTNLSISI